VTTGWLLLAALPWLAVAGIAGLRRPALLLAAYASIIPFGSSISLPVGLPSPFSTATTVLGFVATAGLVVHLLLTRTRGSSLPAPLPWWFFFFAALTLTIVWSVAPSVTLQKLMVLASLLSLYAVSVLPRFGARDLHVIEAGIAVSGALTGLYAVALLLTNSMHVSADGTPRFQTAGGGGEGGDPNITAAALILPLVVSLSASMSERSGLRRLAYLGAAVLTGAAILLTGSRGGLVAVIVVIVVLAFHDRRRLARVVYIGIPVVSLAFAFLFSADATQSRLQAQSTSGRDLIWTVGSQACADHCARGTGWGTFREVFTEYFLKEPNTDRTRTTVGPHSIWLQVPVEAGWLGALLLLIALGLTYRSMWRLPPDRRGVPIAALSGLLVTNTFLSNLDFKYFWLVLMYVAWAVAVHRQPAGSVVRVSSGTGSVASR
jgi:O-antigen ligase